VIESGCEALMNKSSLLAFTLTSLSVLGLVALQLVWAMSKVAAAAGLGRLPRLPESCQRFIRRWLFDERHEAPTT
jgi:hypothetical protein